MKPILLLFASLTICLSSAEAQMGEMPAKPPAGEKPVAEKPAEVSLPDAKERAIKAYDSLKETRKKAEAAPLPKEPAAMVKAREDFDKAKTDKERNAAVKRFREAMLEPKYAIAQRLYQEAWGKLASAKRAFEEAFRNADDIASANKLAWDKADDADKIADMVIEGLVMTKVHPQSAGLTKAATLKTIKSLKATGVQAAEARDVAINVMLNQAIASAKDASLSDTLKAFREEFTPQGVALYLLRIGRLHMQEGRIDEAKASFAEGLALVKDVDTKHRLADTKRSLETMAVVGQPAPAFEAEYALGTKKLKLADYRDSIVVLDFWATWCPSCLRALPKLESIAHARAGEGVSVLAITREFKKHGYLPASRKELTGDAPRAGTQYIGDTPKLFKQHLELFKEKTEITIPFMVTDLAKMRAFAVSALPTTMVVNEKGVIVYAAIGDATAELPKILDLAVAAKDADTPDSED